MTAVTFDPSSPELLADPYPTYARLRAADPVHWSESLRAWVVTRHDDVSFVLSDARFSAAERPPQPRPGRPTTMVTADPPEHSRLRRVARGHFTSTAVEALLPRMREIVSGLLDEAEARGGLDVVWDLAFPLPVTIIAEVLGLPADERERFKRWSDAGVPGVAGRFGEREALRAPDGPGMDAYLRAAIEEHRRAPQRDLIGHLVSAGERREIDADELLDTTAILLTAGNETTTSLIGSGTHALLAHPDQLERLRAEPALIAPAVEELLRFEPPVHAVTRRALERVELRGRAIEAGQTVVACLAAANRDPERFARPEELDIGRAENPHVSFGTGIHACLGGTLARVEARTAIGELVARFPRLRLESPGAEWGGNFILRGLKRLPALV